jgi:Coenzyme PQQ synthesis protein D (PqqD)
MAARSGVEEGDTAVQQLRLRTADLEWREIDGELVALEGDSSVYLAGNPAATLLWQRLAGGATRQELSDALVDLYGIDAAVAERDVDAFLDQARQFSLLEEQ